MVHSCCVVDCTARWGPDKKFFRISSEKDREKRKKWLRAIRRLNLDAPKKAWIPAASDRVCEAHFVHGVPNRDPQHPDYVPHIKMGHSGSQNLKAKEKAVQRYERRIKRQRELPLRCESRCDSAWPERHHLHYVYTAYQPESLPGPVFSAVGLLNDRRISRYSNKEQEWKRESALPDFWRDAPRGPPESKHWFLNLMNILSNCTSSRCPELHVLQRRFGCEVERHPDGTVKTLKVFDEYQYDGEDFIAFNFDTMQWTDKSPQAKATKMRWDGQKVRNQDLKTYLKICMDWISTLSSSIKIYPDINMFAFEAPYDKSKLILTCMATGFYPRDVKMNVTLLGGHSELSNSSEIRPNDDETFQLRISVEINRHDKDGYECHVVHSSLTQPVSKEWDGKCNNCSEESRSRYSIVAVVVVVVAGAVVGLVVVYIRRQR
ncbi:zinc-alpha-2-glycoprotein-like isoform X1 [Xyrauchen texanus]|uniref:zinc-alpha-2-glycoprotein-like isoform X1 n=1 Tax=Xyrauchen texanus TaxID=154827 RepID=UPI002241FFB1|nr:zinc-alpha-2-glycoprotein-like isoform X1 [Xyrauchen texanus]